LNKSTIIIIPCFNEAKRIKDVWSRYVLIKDYTLLFVDDGSTDGTIEILEHLKKEMENVIILRLDQNVGKGNSIYQGVDHLRKNHLLKNINFLGYMDADLSTPISELDAMIKFFAVRPQSQAIFGARINMLGSNIKRSFFRNILSFIFKTFRNLVLNINANDTQCGAKIFRVECIDKAFSSPFETRWLFDIEILKRLNSSNVYEFPLVTWNHTSESKANGFRFYKDILLDIWKIY
jgi:glycosyltransferase involved in cell wall biosynthesis